MFEVRRSIPSGQAASVSARRAASVSDQCVWLSRRHFAIALSTALGLSLAGFMQPSFAKEPALAPASSAPRIQLAILLDTSNSMDGLIDQAKSQLWRIVNEFATCKRNGKRPEVQIALYEYGKPTLGVETGYIRQILPFTTDLDKVSEQLFALKTNGGDEYCGMVIDKAVRELSWSSKADDLKTIYIAGNEPFTQGPVDYRVACKAAIGKGIMVNTIHCGPEAEGVRTNWKDGAMLADGSFLNIDQNKAVVAIEAPQDKEIAKLGLALNDTYCEYGRHGRAGKDRQAAQDRNSASAPTAGAAVQRQIFKSSVAYSNSMWDLCDAVKEKKVKLADIKVEDLPEEMRKLPPEKRQEYIDKKLKEREELQKKIAKLNVERQKYVEAETKRRAGKPLNDTFDAAVVGSLRKQAEKKNFSFEK